MVFFNLESIPEGQSNAFNLESSLECNIINLE